MELLSNEVGLFDQLKNEGCGDLEKVLCKNYTELCSEMECLNKRMTGVCHIVLGYKGEMKVKIEYALIEIEELRRDHERKMPILKESDEVTRVGDPEFFLVS